MTFAAMWMVSIFSIVTANLAIQTNGQILMIKREVGAFQNRADYQSALAELAAIIQQDPFPHEDSKDDQWYGQVNLGEKISQRIVATAQDEESKLNLNHAAADFLNALFQKIEEEQGTFRGSRKDYVKGILKARYSNGFQSLEELLILENFEKEDYEKIIPYVTVYTSDARININTASFTVTRALIDSLGADYASKKLLESRLEEACSQRNCFFENQDLSPPVLAQKLKLPDTPLIAQTVQNFTANLTTDSQVFHVVMSTPKGRKAVSIFRCLEGQLRPEVLSWHEN